MSIFFVIVAGVLWGTMSLFVRNLSDAGFDNYQMMLVRSLLSAVFFGLAILFTDRKKFIVKLKDLWIFAGSGILSLAFFSVCYFAAIIECGAGTAVVLLYTSPVFILILAFLLFNEQISAVKIAAIIMAVSGCTLVAGFDGASSVSLKGLLLGLGAGFGYALYSVFGKIALKKYSVLTLIFYTFVFASIAMLPFIREIPVKIYDGSVLLLCGGISVVCTVLPFLFYSAGLKKLDAGKAGIFVTVEPLVGVLTGLLWWGESIDFIKAAGMLLILCAVLICSFDRVKYFLRKHGFKSRMIVDEILVDMKKENGKTGGQDMFRTWMNVPDKNPVNEKIIVIDAGGTNFRSCLVSFDSEGKALISDFEKKAMPATEREYSKYEFFEKIADNIDYLRDKADKIGFCFSYAMNITKDHDGIPNAFSKEIKAKEVLGVPVGKCLRQVLEAHGWNKIQKIVLLNDTVAALLAGKTLSKDYDSYIGFILGTGMNAAFIDEDNSFGDGRQIIVCESGKCDTVPLSDFDVSADKKTDIPGQYPLEKCCSGAYLGKVAFEMLDFARREKLFSRRTCENLREITSLTTIETDDFLQGKKDNPVYRACTCEYDRSVVFQLFDAAVDRCARYASSILAANLIACGRGKNGKKVCITLNGTTLFKTYRLRERLEKYLYEYAYRKCGISYETVTVEDDITTGTAVAALV